MDGLTEIRMTSKMILINWGLSANRFWVLNVARSDPGPLNLQLGFHVPEDKPVIKLMICSNNECRRTELKAVPETLTIAKERLRERQYRRADSGAPEYSLSEN
jgi:hypothetical protein